MSGKTLAALLGILALAIFLRFWDLRSTPPGLYPDEAMNGNNGVEALAGEGFRVFYPDNNGREGLFINIQALSVKYFGNEPWALRLVSGIFGVLTVWGIFLLTRNLFYSEAHRDRLALLASFFLATGLWHINFSRIGFRAIMAPFFLVWGLYFFFKFYNDIGSPQKQMLQAAAGGLLFGLGFHSYIAYRIAPILLALPIIAGWNKPRRETCFPCLSLIFILFMAMAIIPLALYFLDNPSDFLGRTSQISIFTQASPLKALAVNIAKTAGMFWVYGDPNWRHNFSASPELPLILGVFFLVGLVTALKNISRFNNLFLLAMLDVVLLPVVISSEGLPHALRSIIAIPPVMILSALGAYTIFTKMRDWLSSQTTRYPQYTHQLGRIKKEIGLLGAVLLLALAVNSYDTYFNRWAPRTEVYAAFNARDWEMAMYLKNLPNDLDKYIVITGERIDPRIVTISSQAVLFGTNTFLTEERERKNFHYLSPEELEKSITTNPYRWVEIVFLGEENKQLASALLKKYPNMQMRPEGSFIVLALSP